MLQRLVESEDRGLPVVGQQRLNGPQNTGRELAGQNLAREHIDRRMLLALADVDVRTAMALGGVEVQSVPGDQWPNGGSSGTQEALAGFLFHCC